MSHSSKIVLTSGRWIYLQELKQYLTYGGLLEGMPTTEMNKRLIQRLVEEHCDKPYPGVPYLIRPTEKPIEYNDDRRKYPFGTPSALPAITCIGQFDSKEPARNQNNEMSGLVILWYQDEYAFPIDPTVMAQIQEIHWETHAADMDF